MAIIKSYTSLEQSKMLVEFLPLESADMVYFGIHQGIDGKYHLSGTNTEDDVVPIYKNFCIKVFAKITASDVINQLPCWSLAALSEFILPYIGDDDGNNYKFYLSKDGLDRWIAYYKSDDVSIHICEESDNMIDVIFEIVCWLKKEEYI